MLLGIIYVAQTGTCTDDKFLVEGDWSPVIPGVLDSTESEAAIPIYYLL
jgi:hypothetical protein